MMNDTNSSQSGSEQEPAAIDYMELLMRYLAYWPWFAASVVACLFIACIYLHTVKPVYQMTAKIQIKDDVKGGNILSEFSFLEKLGALSNTSGFDNELEVLRSASLVKQAVYDMNAYCTYTVSRSLMDEEDLYGRTPVVVTMSTLQNDSLEGTLSMDVVLRADSAVSVRGMCYGNPMLSFGAENLHLPGTLHTPAGDLYLTWNPSPRQVTKATNLHVVVASALDVADVYAASLSVSPTSKTTSVAELTFRDTNRRRGIDFLNKLFIAYNRDANNDKNQVALRTEQFINERLVILSQELGSTEQELESFKRGAGFNDVKHDFQLYFEEHSDSEQKLQQAQTQLTLLDYLADYLRSSENTNRVIPANIGVTDAALTALVTTYNDKLLQRKRLLAASQNSNPVVRTLEVEIASLHEAVLFNLASARKQQTIELAALQRQARSYSDRVASAPESERVLTGITRQQDIKAGLFLNLLQKREENSISMAANADNAKVIDAPRCLHAPVSPKTKTIYLAALLIGLALPAGTLYGNELLRYKIADAADVQQHTTLPVLGEIPQYKTGGRPNSLVVANNDDELVTESFRRLRTDLRFMLNPADQQKVILFASTAMGEGKTFVSTNLALSLAQLDKKVLLIGLDIRRPRLAEHFGFSRQAPGITDFLSYETEQLDTLLQDTAYSPNLKILPAGKVPPNPAELLSGPRLLQAVHRLSKQFDYILIDSCPTALLSDTLIAGRVADLTIYVCRAGVTPKKTMGFINSLSREHKLPRMALVVNAVNFTSRSRYRYAYGYGYGRYKSKNDHLKYKSS